MQIGISPKVLKEIKKIGKKDPVLAKQIKKQLVFLKENPKHPSLRIHKLTGYENLWSLSITTSIRIAYLLLDEDRVYITKIGTHDQVYRRN